MNVGQLIAILQTKDPLTTVVLRDPDGLAGYVEARDTESVTLRAYARKGSSFLVSWDAELPLLPGVDVGNFLIHGILIE
jgi:hypothetical protein